MVQKNDSGVDKKLLLDLLAAVFLGVVGALAVLAFHGALRGVRHLLYGQVDGLVNTARALLWWQRLWMPAIGGVVAGLLLQWSRRLQASRTTQDYMAVVTQGDGYISIPLTVLRALSSLCSVVSGASIGRETPMVQLAALGSSVMGRLWHLPQERLRLWVACGVAAGISAAYHAPFAGVLFVAEIMLGTFAIKAIGPLVMASVTAHVVVQQFSGFAPLYSMPAFSLNMSGNMLAFAVLALCAGVLSPAFLHLLIWAKKPFAALPSGALWLRLGLGGLVVGGISTFEPAVWGNGYSVVNSILQGGWLWQSLLMIMLLKMLATAVSTGSGAIGGVFTPTLLVGAVLGAVAGLLSNYFFPGLAPQAAWVSAGMGAFLAANTHAPLMAATMIFEMTGSSQMIVPLLLVCVLATSVKKLLMSESIYTHALPKNTG